MVDWHRFHPTEWQIEYDIEKLAAHGVEVWEAVEVIWNGFVVRPNQRSTVSIVINSLDGPMRDVLSN